MSNETAAIDGAKLEGFIGKILGDWGGAFTTILGFMGDQLGLFRALAAAPGGLTSSELANRTGTVERYSREWLLHMGSAGYLDYDSATGRYSLPPEHAIALTHDDSPFCMAGGFQVVTAMTKAEPRLTGAFRTGEGMFWGEHDHNLFDGTERFFRPGYAANLLSSWIPALDGVEAKLAAGGKVADVGCGHGASTILMGGRFPSSSVYGYDNHAPSIYRARKAAADAGVSANVSFEVAGSGHFPDHGYDLIAFCDCFHDLADPAGAAKRAFETLHDDGAAMIVEPMAGAAPEENFNPIGRVFSGASALC